MTESEQAQFAAISVKLDTIAEKVSHCESALYGDDGHDGMKIDVDRLKRSRATTNAVLWVILTTIIGIGGTVVAGIIAK